MEGVAFGFFSFFGDFLFHGVVGSYRGTGGTRANQFFLHCMFYIRMYYALCDNDGWEE